MTWSLITSLIPGLELPTLPTDLVYKGGSRKARYWLIKSLVW